ncbi:MAG: DNA cytosine methyltransferase, partial [Bacteroidota bacterium]
LAGKRELQQYEGFIWPHIFKIVKSAKPIFCFFENVGSHLSGTFPIVFRDLRSLGYKVEIGLYAAAEAGAPHQRQRLFILAYAEARRFRRCLANTYSKQGWISEKSEWPDSVTVASSGSTLDDSDCTRCARNDEPKATGKETKTKRKGGAAGRTNAEATVLPDTNGQRGQQSVCKRCSTEPHIDGSQWPAGPGQPQFDWEPPRVTGGAKTQSGMGCRINGYDFRADLLRMYGNGVCPPQAAIAWRELTGLVA